MCSTGQQTRAIAKQHQIDYDKMRCICAGGSAYQTGLTALQRQRSVGAFQLLPALGTNRMTGLQKWRLTVDNA